MTIINFAPHLFQEIPFSETFQNLLKGEMWLTLTGAVKFNIQVLDKAEPEQDDIHVEMWIHPTDKPHVTRLEVINRFNLGPDSEPFAKDLARELYNLARGWSEQILQ